MQKDSGCVDEIVVHQSDDSESRPSKDPWSHTPSHGVRMNLAHTILDADKGREAEMAVSEENED